MVGHVLRPEEYLSRARYDFAAPDERLSPWVERYWSSRWSLGADRFAVATLDDPSVHLTAERGGVQRAGVDGSGVWVTGPITRGRFDVTLFADGSVVGVKFRLGGTLAFTDASLAAVRDATVPAASWFESADGLADLPGAATEAAPLLDAWLLSRSPRSPDGFVAFQRALTELADPAVTRLDALAGRTHTSVRSLQRLFHRFLGVGPKRMLLRARVSDAVAAIDRGWTGSWAELASTYGWFDQAHFIRDFRQITGHTPAAYAASRRANQWGAGEGT